MKRKTLWIPFLLLFFLILTPARGETQRKLTLMVYMCGSNLESSGGSASEDLREIMEAMPAGKDFSLLVMTGGSDLPEGTGYFQQENAGIYEAASGGRIRRVVPFTEPVSMGDPEALASLLRYGQENRPAERYALILWDHGGGPMEGVCWDEAFGMDHLTMTEVTEALAAGLDGKLDWIGFDACLMSSLEVAGQLAPYAEYMIASQETEPAFGWNYSFLKDITKDGNGAETGRRIVDAYFEGQENSGETLTLACLDLSVVPDVIAAMDPVFLPLCEEMDEEKYLSLSALRMTAAGFGKADPGYSVTGYDLVDLRDLISGMEQTEATGKLLELLERAVVCSRANEEGAGGLTLYYPYANQTKYLEKWKDDYAALSFSPGYQAYVNAFGSLLTGETLFRWENLVPEAGSPETDGAYPFSLPLTAEQAENVVSAQLLILRDTRGNRLEDNCVLVASAPAEIGADHVIRARWDGRCLYAEDGNGELTGPVSFRVTDDGTRSTVIARYNEADQYDLEGQTAFFELDAQDTREYPEILRIRVWDEATESFSSRMSFSEEKYNLLLFWNLHRAYPGAGESKVLPDLAEWAEDSSWTYAQGIRLPQPWRLRFVRTDSGEQYYAIFRLLDSQQKAVCSVPAEVPNNYRTPIVSGSEPIENEMLRTELSCTADTSPDSAGLHLEWTIRNLSNQKIRVRAAEAVLNGERVTNGSASFALEPGQTQLRETALSLWETAGLEALDSVSGMLEVTPEDGEMILVPYFFAFDHEGLDTLQPGAGLSETVQENGISLRLLGTEPDGRCGKVFYLLAENGQAASAEMEFLPKILVLNNLAFPQSSVKPLSGGMSRVYALNASNSCSTIALQIAGTGMQVTRLEDYLLQAAGENELHSISLWAETGTGESLLTELTPADPLPLEAPEHIHSESLFYPVWEAPDGLNLPEEEKLPVLAENNVMRILLRRAAAGENGISLSLEVRNLSEQWINPEIAGCTVNGEPVDCWWTVPGGIPPHAVLIREADLVPVLLPEAEQEIRILTLAFYDSESGKAAEAPEAVLTPENAIPLGEAGGFWLNGDAFSVQTARLPDAAPEEPAEEGEVLPLDSALTIPENPASYRVEMEIGLEPEIIPQIRNCKAALVRENAEGYLEILTLQDVKPDEAGKMILHHPGLIPTVEADPQLSVMTYLLRTDEKELYAEVFLGISMSTESMDTFQLDSIRWTLDYPEGTAEIESFEQDQAPYTRLSDILSATLRTYEVSPDPLPDGTLPHLADMPRRNDFMWYLNAPQVRLSGAPLRLMLRPVTPEDSLSFLISVSLTDGTRYSLPLIPFP